MIKKSYLFFAVFSCCFTLLVQSASAAPNRIVASPSTMAVHPHPTDIRSMLTRILQVTLYHGDKARFERSPEKMQNVARAVSSFQPSLVSALLYLSEEKILSADQIEAFQFFRKEILLANPRCKFDVKLNVTSYATAAELISKLQEINTKLGPDSVTLTVPKSNEVVYPSALIKGIDYLHLHGQLVGYEGPPCMIPDGVDFLLLRAEKGEVHREEIASLRTKHRLPLLVQVGTSFWDDDSINFEQPSISLNQAKLLTHLAEEQNAFGYHFIYPVLCAMVGKQHDFHELTESSLLVTMRALMTRFN